MKNAEEKVDSDSIAVMGASICLQKTFPIWDERF